jgi:hypothetical protein
MVKLLLAVVRWVVLVGALVVVLLGVGRLVEGQPLLPQRTPPAAATPTPGPTTEEARNANKAPKFYAQSCAASHAWAKPVTTPFLCIDVPKSDGTVSPTLRLQGYVGGVNGPLTAAVFNEMDDGARTPPSGDIRFPIEPVGPGTGMPALWESNIGLGGLPAGQGKLHIEVFAEDASGKRTVEAKLDVRMQH